MKEGRISLGTERCTTNDVICSRCCWWRRRKTGTSCRLQQAACCFFSFCFSMSSTDLNVVSSSPSSTSYINFHCFFTICLNLSISSFNCLLYRHVYVCVSVHLYHNIPVIYTHKSIASEDFPQIWIFSEIKVVNLREKSQITMLATSE